MIKAIFFDFDGILFDTERYYNRVEQAFVEAYKYPIPKERMKLLICADTSIDIFDEILKGYEDKVDKQEFKDNLNKWWKLKTPITPYKDLLFKDVKPALKWLKENGYIVACASRSALDYIKKGLEEVDIIDYFDLYVTGQDFKLNKPAPDCYLYCRDYFKLNSDECLVVEDSPNGIKAAHNANMKVVVRKDYDIGLNQEGGDFYLDDYSELPQVLNILKQNR